MKYIIDLIDDIRENIKDDDSYTINIGLLKEDKADESKLIYAGEARVCDFVLDDSSNKLIFSVTADDSCLLVGELMPALLISDMKSMMYELRININSQHKDIKVVGFGKNDDMKSYVLFIKI